MRARWLILAGVPVVAMVAVILVVASNPLRRSDEHIRKQLLRDTPLGTQFITVRQHIADNGWRISYVDEKNGFYDQRTRPARTVGEKSIRASLGDYQDMPFKANVTVFYGFDREAHLIDIWVWKTWDGL